LLVITGWQMALRLGLASACLWIVAQTFAGGALLAASIGLPLLVSSVGAVIGFQLFALACADVTRQERRARSALDAALVELGAAQKALLAQERAGERLRIARDLHDDLGHGLTAIGLLAARAEMETADPGAQAQAAVLKREASGLLAQLRATVTDLRSDETSAAARIDLAAALGAIARPGVWPLAIHVDLAPEAATMAAEPGIAIVRLVREAITNAVRHGGAAVSAVHIGILAQSGRWHIAVCDDGGGAAAPCLGNGLSGMRERIEALGGSLHIDSQPGAGWRLSASVPQARR
jgi:signal transduction histidine kinase